MAVLAAAVASGGSAAPRPGILLNTLTPIFNINNVNRLENIIGLSVQFRSNDIEI